MPDWSHGYNVSMGYTYGFYRELAPDWLDLCARIQGFLPPDRGPNGEFRYLELGSGQGLGLCILASLHPNAHFIGVDFNPEHIAHARALSVAGGLTNIEFIEADFAALAQEFPPNFAECDYITLHGIFSWIPPVVRQGLMSCIDKASRPGSLIYLSYNCLPGWLPTVPFQHIARKLQTSSALSGPVALTQAADLFDAIGGVSSPLLRALPGLTQRSQMVRTQDPAYAVQEYLHDNWEPFWFSSVADDFAAIKCTYVGSAHIPETLMPAMMPPAMRDLVLQQSDPILRIEIMDCILNQGFRRDIFCRGPRRIFSGANAALSSVRLSLGSEPKDNEVKVATNVGEAALPVETVRQVVTALAQRPHTIAELMALPTLANAKEANHLQAILLLIHSGVAMIDSDMSVSRHASALNCAIATAASDGAPYTFMAAPAFATAIKVRDIDCILLNVWLQERSIDEGDLANKLLAVLRRLGRGMSHEGNVLTGDPLNQRAKQLANTFLLSTLPRWLQLGIIF